MAPLALVANLTTRWHHLHKLQTWTQDGACISYIFDQQVVPLALVALVAICTTIICIGSTFDHQVAQLALVLKWATRLHHCNCIATFSWIAHLALSVGIEMVSSSARVTSVKSWTDRQTQRSDPRYLGPIKTFSLELLPDFLELIVKRLKSSLLGFPVGQVDLHFKSQNRFERIYVSWAFLSSSIFVPLSSTSFFSSPISPESSSFIPETYVMELQNQCYTCHSIAKLSDLMNHIMISRYVP